jgi:hypothetical protein
MFHAEVEEKIKTHISRAIMWKNEVEQDRPQMAI